MSALDTLLDAGITYRQIDTWVHNGWLRPIGGSGSGHPREWPWQEITIALLMKRLTGAGVATAKAAEAARDAETIRSLYGLTSEDPVTVELDDGLTLTITPASQQAAA